MYRPKTKETQIAYELVLAFVKGCIGDQPQEILRGAADEVRFARVQRAPPLRVLCVGTARSAHTVAVVRRRRSPSSRTTSSASP
jgi:hypothetical protein